MDLGVQKGDRVAALLDNCSQYIELYAALAKVGAIAVPLNFRLAKFELTSILNDSGSETILFGEDFEERVGELRPDIPVKDKNYICVGGKRRPGPSISSSRLEAKLPALVKAPDMRLCLETMNFNDRHTVGKDNWGLKNYCFCYICKVWGLM
jgi:acyl-CoA synthetase (AMP-forming)/AMP-acid ligase II